MTNQLLLERASGAVPQGAGPRWLSGDEAALIDDPDFACLIAPWITGVEDAGVMDAKTGAYLAPLESNVDGPFLPIHHQTGGPDGAPYFEARSADPVGVLQSDAGLVEVEDFTLCIAARAANNATGTVIGLAGADGGALGINLRNNNYARFVQYDGNENPSYLIDSSTTSSTAYHILTLSYNKAAQTTKLWRGSSLIGTHSGLLTPPQSRLVLFKAYDSVDDLNTEADTARIAAAWAINRYCGGTDTTLFDRLIAAMKLRFPSLAAT